jgi:hypothetical protein
MLIYPCSELGPPNLKESWEMSQCLLKIRALLPKTKEEMSTERQYFRYLRMAIASLLNVFYR